MFQPTAQRYASFSLVNAKFTLNKAPIRVNESTNKRKKYISKM